MNPVRMSLPQRGSSPLARGTPSAVKDNNSQSGLIPARAGNTRRNLAGAGLPRAHPRSRGEHYIGAPARMFPLGSSPLARGAQHGRSRGTIRRGLIPARAGSTFGLGVEAHGLWAHPRSRGEHFLAGDFDTRRWGSSPLARGAQDGRVRRARLDGLIPARAGST